MAWGTGHDKPDSLRSLSIPGLVKRIALEAPGKTACSRGGQNWSYGQLDAASLFLARLFHARGLCAGDEVPIFLSRCFDSVASILALMRLGVCFVPMDAESWSQGRVDAVLKAVQPSSSCIPPRQSSPLWGFPPSRPTSSGSPVKGPLAGPTLPPFRTGSMPTGAPTSRSTSSSRPAQPASPKESSYRGDALRIM